MSFGYEISRVNVHLYLLLKFKTSIFSPSGLRLRDYSPDINYSSIHNSLSSFSSYLMLSSSDLNSSTFFGLRPAFIIYWLSWIIFVVEDEFEFFQFLIFLLEFVNPLFFVSDSGVSLFALLFELLVVFAFLLDLLLLVVDVVVELFLLIFSFVELLLECRQLLPHQVQLSLCFQRLIFNRVHFRKIFFIEFIDLSPVFLVHHVHGVFMSLH